jgi:predicted molibdopterin-dependent oxidoreductase YjgC
VNTGSEFRILEDATKKVRVTFNDQEIAVAEGGNLAAELLVAGITPFRQTPVSNAPRNPFCMMGACFDCLVEIEGKSVQSCMVQAREGMVIKSASPIQDCPADTASKPEGPDQEGYLNE